jgi:hypothetical protein
MPATSAGMTTEIDASYVGNALVPAVILKRILQPHSGLRGPPQAGGRNECSLPARWS